MSHDPVQMILSRLENVKSTGESKWSARCPAHEDKQNSLSIGIGEDGRVLLKCFAACDVKDIATTMRLELKDLFPSDKGDFPSHTKRPAKQEKPRKVYSRHDELVRALEFQSKGKFAQEWIYSDPDGKEVFRVFRLNFPDGGKTCRPVCPVDGGWVCGDPNGPLPLYNLPRLAEASRVYVVEGEKCCDAAGIIGLIGTTSAHGSKSACKSEWAPLAGKDVVVIPDNDDPGGKYADEVAGILSRLTPPAKVKILRLPGLESKEDIFDFIAKRNGVAPDAIRAEIEFLAEQAPVWTPGESAKALEPAEYQPFPTDALPGVVRDFVEQGTQALNCDPAFIALPLLAAMAAAIGNTRRIILRRDWFEPCVLWTACVGDSGTLKSPAMDLALSALRDRHGEAMRDFQTEIAAYKESKLEYERELQRWKKSKDNVPPPQDAEEPIPTRYLCSDVTVEALAVMLSNQPRGVLLERDELNGWLKSFGAYKNGKGGDGEHWLSMYGARSLTVDRKSGDAKIIFVPRAAVSITGGVQPQILKRTMAGEHVESGMAARFLLAMPPRRKRAWTEAELDPTVKAGVSFLFQKLLELDFSHGADGSTSPIGVTLSPEAKTAWIRFYEDHSEISYALTNPALKAAYAKIEGIGVRLSLIIHCVRMAVMEPDVQPALIDEQSVQMAVTLARWFRSETTRIYDILSIGDDETCDGHNSLIELVRSKGGRLTVRELSHCSRKYRDDPEGNLQGLVDQGFGKWELIPSGSTGGRPTKYFELTEAC